MPSKLLKRETKKERKDRIARARATRNLSLALKV